MTDPGGRPVRHGAVVADQNEIDKAKDGAFECEPCSPGDLPVPTSKQVRSDMAEREALEGMAALNKGWAPGTNPRRHWPTARNPNARWDGKRFIPNTGFYDLPRPIKGK